MIAMIFCGLALVIVGGALGLLLGYKIATNQCEADNQKRVNELCLLRARVRMLEGMPSAPALEAKVAELREDNIRLLNEKFKENAGTQGES